MKLGALGEDKLLHQILLHFPRGKAREAFPRAGDDCALVKMQDGQNYLVLKTDCVVEGVHFVQRTNTFDVG